MSLKFTKEMIDDHDFINTEIAANRAQIIFNEWLSKQHVIYGQLAAQDHAWNTIHSELHDTHVARLVDIAPIKKKICEHEPRGIIDTLRMGPELSTFSLLKNIECRKCGKMLQAKFEEVD